MQNHTFQKHMIEQSSQEEAFIKKSIQKMQQIFDTVARHQTDAPQGGVELQSHLTVLKNRLQHYFKIQERYGILENMIREFPRIASAVKSLYDEHRLILRLVEDMLVRVNQMIEKGDPLDFRNLETEYENIVGKFKKNQSKLYDLVIGTYNLDIGCGD